MKGLNKSALMAAALSILVITSGCGKKGDENTGSGNPGYNNGYYNGNVQVLSNGAAAIYFSGTNIYNSGNAISGGAVSNSNVGSPGTYCDYQINGANMCHTFQNNYRSGGAGVVAVGGNSMPVGQPGTMVGASAINGIDSGITLVATPGNAIFHSNVSGVITLGAQYLHAKFPSGMPAVTAVSFDLISYGTVLSGYVLIQAGGTVIMLVI